MPNHITSKIELIGEKKQVQKLVDRFSTVHKDRLQMPDFEKIVPNPEILKDTEFCLSIINHAKNDKAVGRLLTLYKELKHFNSLDFSVQDNGETLKIFLG